MSAKSVAELSRQSKVDGKEYRLLDSHWVTKKQYPLFRMPNEQDYSIGKNSQWFMDMSLLVSYYSALVTSPFDMFWSELLYQASLPLSMKSFLQLCPRDIKSTSIPNDFLSIIKQIYALVLLIHVRASRAHESDDMFLRPFEHRQFLHKNLIFDVPGLIDFAALYGHDSPDLVSDIFKSVFENGSEYIKDSGNIMESAVAALEMVGKRVGEWQFETNHQPVSSDTDAFNTVEKTIEYLADAGKALGVFLALVGQVNSSVAETCLQLNIVPKLANFYNTTIIGIRRHILRNITWTHDQKSDLMSKLATAAAAFLKLVRVGIIEPALVHKIMQLAFDAPDPHRADASAVSSKAESLKKASHLLLALMMEMLNCSEFAIAYASLYHVDDDIILLRETSKSGDLDKQQLDYIQQCFSQLTAESVGRREQAVKVEVAPPSVSALLGDDADAEPQPGPSRPREFLDVKEVCPETNDDLIVRCLDYYKNDSAAVISALLDDNVPPEVMDPDAVKHTASVKENLPLDAFTRTMDLASAAASGVEQLRPGQLWQGKRNADAETQPLSKDDRDRITQLAVSVWDDDDEHSGDFFVQPNTNGLVETIYDGKEWFTTQE
uniref:CUE domain-containing protein n=1 Tax=Mesocestoides corti TaxID=53468 RepID=A0A5K3EUG1_MESCO